MYKIFEVRNLADTWRDPDEIKINDLGYHESEKSAINFANKHMKENYYRTWGGETPILKESKQSITLTDGQLIENVKYFAFSTGSWAPMLIIQEIELLNKTEE